MKNKFFKSFLLAVVLLLGVFANAFASTSASSAVFAEEMKTVEVSSSLPYVNESTVKNVTGLSNIGNFGDDNYTEFKFYIDNQEVNSLLKAVETSDFTTHSYTVDRIDKTKTGTSWGFPRYSSVTTSNYVSGSFSVRVYSQLDIDINTEFLPEGKVPTYIVDGAQGLIEENRYKIYSTDNVVISFEEIEGYNIFVNDVKLDSNTYSITNVTSNTKINVTYKLSTDNDVVLDQNTISALSNGSLSKLTINSVEFTSRKNEMVVEKETTLNIVATPNENNLIRSISINGEVISDNNAEYPNFAVNYTTEQGKEYIVSVELYNAQSTISFVGNGTVMAKFNNKNNNVKETLALPRNTQVEVTVSPNKNYYITNCSIENVNATPSYVNGNAVFTFTTGVQESYIINLETEELFSVVENNLSINKYDVIRMLKGEEDSKNIVYNTLWNNYNTNTNITIEDVEFEFLAATYALDLSDLPLVGGVYNVEFYYPINEKIIATRADLIAYVNNLFNIEEDSLTAKYIIPAALSEKTASEIIAQIHDFGTQENETIKLKYKGNNIYPATDVVSNIQAVDLRENVTLDINTEISVVYGNYTDADIMALILEDRSGLVSENGEQLINLNSELYLDETLVGVDAGTDYVNICFGTQNEFYKGVMATVTVVIEKADAEVNISSGIIDYQASGIEESQILSISPNVTLENEAVDHVYFVMGLDIVDEELIARVDLSQMSSDNGLIDMNTIIWGALQLIDPEEDGLTLVEFAKFVESLATSMNNEGQNFDVSKYMGQITEVLTKVSEVIDIRIMIEYKDTANITPQQHGIYLAGIVTTDKNYNIAADVGYVVIAAEILNVDFVAKNGVNNLRKFEYDGTPKTMEAEAYDINQQVATGNMKYYYVGLKTDGSFYASDVAPSHSGAYTVLAMFSNAFEGELPSQVGLGVGAMVIVPTANADISVDNKVTTYNGENVDISTMVTRTNSDAKVAYITASVTLSGNFMVDGFDAIDGRVNIDFPTRFDNILKEYFPEEFENGVNVDTFIKLLNKVKENLSIYGYSIEYIDSLINELNNITNTTLITFNNISDINTSEAGIYVIGAIIFDPNYLPKSDLAILVIQPELGVSTMAWNYNDTNGIITESKLAKIDMTASIIGGNGENINYLFFGLNEEGKPTKVTNIEDITSGFWLQLAYADAEVSNEVNVVLPIARLFYVVSEIIEVENKVVCFNGEEHNVEYTELLNTEYVLVVNDSSKLNIVFPNNWNIDHKLDQVDSLSGKINEVVALIEKYLPENYVTEIKSMIQMIVDKYSVENIVINNTLPIEIGEYNITVIAIKNNYQVAIAQANLTIKDHKLVSHEAKAPTCLETGWNEYFTCEHCSYTTYEELEALGHSAVVDGAVAPTCTATGLTEGSHCSVCGEVLVEQEVVAKIAHTPSEWIVIENATCTENGSAHKTCTICNTELETKELDKLAHGTVRHDAKAPTCTEVGWNEYYTCEHCNYTSYEEIDMVDHNVVVDPAVAPTCDTMGATEGSHCSVCNQVIVEQDTLAKLGHMYGEWVVETQATATVDGRYERSCTICNNKDYSVIPAYGNRDVANVEINDSNNGKVTINTDSINNAIKDVIETGKKEVVISAGDAVEVLNSVEMNTSSLQDIVNADSILTIRTTNVHATFDKNALNTIISSADNNSIEFNLRIISNTELNEIQQESIEDMKVAAVLSAQVICGENTISNFGDGKVQVRVPFEVEEGKSADNYKIMYVAEDGSISELATSYIDGHLVVELEHFSEYIIVDTTVDTDTNPNPAAKIAIILFVVFAALACVVPFSFMIKERKK